MSSQLGEAFIPIRATLDKLDSDLAGARSKVDGALGKISGSIQKAVKVAIAGIAGGVAALGVGIIGVFSKAVPAASNLNEALNATNVVFGESADIVQDFGKRAADAAGLSEAAFNQLAATTGAMLQNYGLDSDTAAQATVDLGQRAADMASIFNTDVEEALTAINAAMRGEADPIERFGVSMNAAAVEAKALEMGLADTTGELDQAALTQARLALLFEQTDKIAGDFVNTSGDLANASRVQSARWENFMAKIGAFALPILNTFQKLLLDIGERVFPIIVEAVAPFAEVVAGLAEGFSEFIGALFEGTDPLTALSELVYNLGVALGMGKVEAALLSIQFQDLITRIQEIAANIWVMLEPIVTAITNFVSWQDVLIALGIIIASVIIPTVISLVASMLPIIVAVAGVVAAVALLRNAWESDWGGIRTSLTAWWEESGKPIFETVRVWLSENIPQAIERLKTFWVDVLKPAIETVWSWLTGTLIPFFQNVLIPFISQHITSALKTLGDFWTNTLKPAIETVWSWLNTVLIPFITGTLIPTISDKLTSAIQTLSDFWTNTLKPALDGVWAFLDGYIIPLFSSLWELFNVAGSLAIQALAGLWQNTLQPALETVWNFIQNSIIPIFEGLARVSNDELSPVLNWLTNTVLAGVITGFEGIKQAIVFVIGVVSSLIAKLKEIKLPPALTPGSPTPFEIGLLGINAAMQDFNNLLDQNALITAPALSLNPADTLGNAGELTREVENNSAISYNPQTTVITNQDPLRVLRASRHLDRLGEIA